MGFLVVVFAGGAGQCGCHPERSEGSSARQQGFLASLGMTDMPAMTRPIREMTAWMKATSPPRESRHPVPRSDAAREIAHRLAAGVDAGAADLGEAKCS